MDKRTYNKAEIIPLSVSMEKHILAGSLIENINVSDVGQDLAPTIDFEDEPFSVEWQ